MDAKMIRVGRHFINISNLAYIHMPIVKDVTRAYIDIVFTSSENKIRLHGKEATDLINFFESNSDIVSP